MKLHAVPQQFIQQSRKVFQSVPDSLFEQLVSLRQFVSWPQHELYWQTAQGVELEVIQPEQVEVIVVAEQVRAPAQEQPL